MKKWVAAIACLALSYAGIAQSGADTVEKWSNHFQVTVISQAHSAFKSLYKGNNSLAHTVEPTATSMTATLFIGRKLWKGAAFYLNQEVSGGKGLSFAKGAAGALNGETYRVGATEPKLFIARAYLQQNIALANTTYDTLEDNINQLAGKIPASRITISAGKFAISDFYDNNSYSHNPRSQFLNWSLMSNGAWDYPANTRGYTFGAVVELIKPKWAVRLSSVTVPKVANAPALEYDITKAHSETLELEKRTGFGKRPGGIRFLLSNTHSKAPSYSEGLKAINNQNKNILDIISGNTEGDVYGGKKFGLGISAEQELTDNIGAFARAGWNDGKYATWAFTEIDRSAHAGLSIRGRQWKRPDDVLGIAGVLNGLFAEHRAFVAAGGYGFIVGDGRLNYGKEGIIESYYNARLTNFFWLSFDYQFVNNPGYNKDRGPAHVFAIRGHVEL